MSFIPTIAWLTVCVSLVNPKSAKLQSFAAIFFAIFLSLMLSFYMPEEAPPPMDRRRTPISRRNQLIIGLASIPACIVGALILLRLFNLLRPFSVPTGTMTPALSPGDHVFSEGIAYLFRKPHRGDIVVFKTAGIQSIPQDQFYVKRIAGEPGDHLRIAGGKLFINEKPISLSNALGEIVYDLPPQFVTSAITNLTVPDRCYFVLGDNSTNSFDSRFWGCVPRGNIIGRVAYCYYPLQRSGRIR
jgi:signal peptidase I